MATQAEVRILRLAASVALIALGAAAASGWAGEWASWRGEEQTGVSTERDLVSQWSKDGENLLWRVDFTIPRHRYFAFDKRSGEVLWVSTPGGSLQDANTQSTPVVAEIDGQRLVIGGSADGWIYALEARTGEKVWGFHLSKRGLNSSVVVGAATVYASHSEGNVDAGTMGRVVAIDGTGRGEVTATHERWRAEGIKAGFASPLLHDARLYVVDNSANLHALEAATGKRLWLHNLGTVGKASPVWADGKIYATEVNGNFHILRPGPEGATALDEEHFEIVAEGRYAEIYGSPAVAYGRIFFVTEEGLYCLGDESAPPVVPPLSTALAGVPTVVPAAADAAPALIRVVPAEVAHDGVLFILSRNRLFALAEGIEPEDPASGSLQASLQGHQELTTAALSSNYRSQG